jgi:hypothetical protein
MSNNRDEHGEPKRLKETQKFWKDYWAPLSRALNMSMQPDSEYSQTDTIIKRKKWENKVFKEYYTTVSAYVEESHNVFKEDFIEDASGDTWIFGLNTAKLSEKYLELVQWGAFKKWIASKKVWKRIHEDINSTPNKILLAWEAIDSERNKQEQLNYITTQLELVSAGILSAHGGNARVLPSINAPTWHLGEQFNKWGINFAEDLGDVSAGQVKNGDKTDYFQKVAQRIMTWAMQEEYSWETPTELLVEKTKTSASSATRDDGSGYE